MMRDRLEDAIAWAEAEAEKARLSAEYYAASPYDHSGANRAKAAALTETAERLEALAEAARGGKP